MPNDIDYITPAAADWPAHCSAVRGHLNDLLNRLFVEHRKLNDRTGEASVAYEARWEILNELEEFLQERVVELAPHE